MRQASCRRDASPWRPVPGKWGRGAPTSGLPTLRDVLPLLLPGATDESVADDVQGFVVPTVSLLVAVVVAYLTATLLSALVNRAARRSAVAADLTRRSRKPVRAVLLVVSLDRSVGGDARRATSLALQLQRVEAVDLRR